MNSMLFMQIPLKVKVSSYSLTFAQTLFSIFTSMTARAFGLCESYSIADVGISIHFFCTVC